MSKHQFTDALLGWYRVNSRDLPWRNTNDPYNIWLSEVILQQTRVAQGLPYFEKFINKYPKVLDLALAPEDDVLRLWQGLGYYSRARNLHRCAKMVVEAFNGEFPDNYKDLLKLPGVGSYTAAAIASFAFAEPVAVVDGNVFRVLSRFFGIATDIGSTEGKKEFGALANGIIPPDRPGIFNQAIMEFGALHCTPQKPQCSDCVLKAGCVAYRNDMVGELPVKANRVKIKQRFLTYSYITCNGHTVVNKRGGGDIWQGLYDFPLVESGSGLKHDVNDISFLNELESFKPNVMFDPEITFKHILTHQRIFANFVTFRIRADYLQELQQWAVQKGFALVDMPKLEGLAKPRLILRFLNGEK